MSNRTDPHSVSRFNPSDYTYAFAYAAAHTIDGWVIPAFNVEPALHAVATGKRAKCPMADGSPRGIFSCDVCGAHFVHGEAWEHTPTGELVFLGHQCAAKYEMHAEDPAYAKALAAHRGRVTARLQKLARIASARRFLAERPELKAALRCGHRITRDLVAKLLQWGNLTDGQANLALKLAREATEKAAEKVAEPEWATIPADLGRATFKARVLHTKWVQGFGYNQETLKMLVAAELADGRVLKLWGTCPDVLLGQLVKGRTITFAAKVEPSKDDPKFGFFSRPTKAAYIDGQPEANPVAGVLS